MKQLKSGFKRTINWKYHPKATTERHKQYLDYLIDLSFQGVNRGFAWSFEANVHQTSHKQYFLQTLEIKDYNIMIDGHEFFDQPVKNNSTRYDSIHKIGTGQGDDYTTGCLLY